MTNTCNPSIPVVSPRYQLIASSKQMQGKSYSLPPLLGKAEGPGSSSAKSSCSLGNKPEDCSQNAGIHKSQISLWVESGQSMHSGNLSGAHNRRVDEVGKPNRKRARPGENPRPRPKDRQMIMDRVKELREIVPNCAKVKFFANGTLKYIFYFTFYIELLISMSLILVSSSCSMYWGRSVALMLCLRKPSSTCFFCKV